MNHSITGSLPILIDCVIVHAIGNSCLLVNNSRFNLKTRSKVDHFYYLAAVAISL